MTDSSILPTNPQALPIVPQTPLDDSHAQPVENTTAQPSVPTSTDPAIPSDVSLLTPQSVPTVASSDPQVDDLVQQTIQLQQDFQQTDQDFSVQSVPPINPGQPTANNPVTTLQATPPIDAVQPTEANQVAAVPPVDPTFSSGEAIVDETTPPAATNDAPIGDQTIVQAAAPVPSTDDATTAQANATDTPTSDVGKSPLDILEDILGGAGGEGVGPDGKPAEPTQTPEELAAELQAARDKVAQEEALVIEEHRKKMLSELQTPEQQKRDEVRNEQAQQMKTDSQFDIPQIERKKMVLDNKKK